MRGTALMLGVLGGLIAGGLGMKWLVDIGTLTDDQRMMAQAMGRSDELQAMGIASLLLIGSLVAGIAGGFFSHRGKLALGGSLMLAGGVVPLIYASQAIFFTLVLIAGGVVALSSHFKQARNAVH